MSNDRLIWCDIETFGLDAEVHPILEIGFRITDLDMETLDEFQCVLWDRNYPLAYAKLANAAEQGDQPSKYVLEMHAKSGLWAEADETGIPAHQAWRETQNWLEKHKVSTDEPLCGSSVQFDRRFLEVQMPDAAALFSYRNIDISTLKELCKRYNPTMFTHLDEDTQPQKLHRVIPDLDDTIKEALWYRDNFLFHSL